MSNQYTKKEYTNGEMNSIISMYSDGMSFSKVAAKVGRQKNQIKKLLIEAGVFVENRDNIKVEFTTQEIDNITKMYTEGLSASEIGIRIGTSKTPIINLLKRIGLLRKGKSNGVKIVLNKEQEDQIKNLYLISFSGCSQIAEFFSVSEAFLSKLFKKEGILRDRSYGGSVGMVKRYRGISYSEYLKTLDEYGEYRRNVLKITNKQQIHLLENFYKRGVSGKEGAYQLDHKYSILEGFKNNISVQLIGNINNLQFIPWKENAVKRTKCSITIDNLIKI